MNVSGAPRLPIPLLTSRADVDVVDAAQESVQRGLEGGPSAIAKEGGEAPTSREGNIAVLLIVALAVLAAVLFT